MLLLRLFFSLHGRIARGDFWYATLVILSIFIVLSIVLETLFSPAASWVLYPVLYWTLLAVAIKRYHDIGRSGLWLLLLLVPVIGPAWAIYSLGFRKGGQRENRYGPVPELEQLDYFRVGEGRAVPQDIVTDVTGLVAVPVARIVRPTTVEEVRSAIIGSTGPISIGGGHFSMGGQTTSPGSLHIDMRGMNSVIAFAPSERWIRVQAGIRWCDIQRFLDPHDLSVKIMQTYANFTVGGALSVNAHGRYIGLGPVILSVRSISIVDAAGGLHHASPTENAEMFHGAIGGYSALGVIVEAELDVVPNTRVACVTKKMPANAYTEYFRENVRNNPGAVFHNADLYPPHYTRVRAQTWQKTERPVTQTSRLMPLRSSFPLQRYFLWAISETPLGKWRREFIVDPLLFFRQRVHWRNYEAGYDVAELEPSSREKTTYVLQEYFVPVECFEDFLPKMSEILNRYRVNMINISIRHANADPGSMLAWAHGETFAFVMYYKQQVDADDRGRVAVWTRELIDAVLEVGGTYYLPYQAHATADQFHRAYPRAEELFALKRRVDPGFRFRNVLWDRYYAPWLERHAEQPATNPKSEFHRVFFSTSWSDAFYQFLQNIYHLYPEHRFHRLIAETAGRLRSDREIYEAVQAGLPGISAPLAPLTFALPSLMKQKREMTRQALELLGDRRACNGYLEIGSVGRYVSVLRRRMRISGPVHLMNDAAPTNSAADIMERGGIRKIGRFHTLDYAPLDAAGIAPASLDLVTCFIGLHHAPLDRLDEFVRSINRVLRPGGMLILRDHDVRTPEMATFVSLVHTVFNLGLGTPWVADSREFKAFRSVEEWSGYITRRGFRDHGERLLQANDPTDNVLMAFVKTDAREAA
ncbi:MAG: DUF805 domain-containing protein [Bacteroidetes bacterium]|nr:DUF805 domain-containing protein [Bacteroidota bacterium]